MMTRLITNVAQICSCSIDSNDLLNSQLQCFEGSTETVTFRTQLTGSREVSTSELLTAIEQWTDSDTSFLDNGVRLTFNTTCPLVISDFDSEECPNTVATPTMGSLTNNPISITLIVSVILGLLLLVSLVVNVVICCCLCWRSRHTKAELYDVRGEQNGQGNNPYVYNRNDQQQQRG